MRSFAGARIESGELLLSILKGEGGASRADGTSEHRTVWGLDRVFRIRAQKKRRSSGKLDRFVEDDQASIAY